jgi:hypothetical protein
MMPRAKTMRSLMMVGGYTPLGIAGLMFLKTVAPTDAILGNSTNYGAAPGRRVEGPAPNMQCSLNAAGQSVTYAGGSVTFAGYVNAVNNGSFTATDNTNTATIYFTNPAGVTEPATFVPTVASATVLLPGLVTSHADLVAGYPFSQATHAQKFAVNDAVIPGKRVIGGRNSARWLECISAPLAGQLNGAGDCTAFLYFYPTAIGAAGNTTNWMEFRDAGATNSIQFAYSTTSTVFLVVMTPAGFTQYTGTLSTPLALNTWQLLAVTLSGTTATWFVNGVQRATQTTTPTRTRAGLDRVYVGAAPGRQNGTSASRAIEGAVARAMTAAELLELTAWCQGEYA